MANAKDATVASKQNEVDPKAVHSDGHDMGEGLADDKISIKSTTCERFSIRGYVATIRKLDRDTCWPFPQHLQETRLKEAGSLALPALEIPDYRWWNCENCLREISFSGERPSAKEYMRDSHTSMQARDGRLDRGSPMTGMHLPTSSVDMQGQLKKINIDDTEVIDVDMQEKLKETMLDDTEAVKNLTVDLKSGDSVGFSAYETDKGKKDEEVVTNILREHVRTESTVAMELENGKFKFAELDKNKSGTLHCVSSSRNSEEIINTNDTCPCEQDENAVCDEKVQAVMETLPSMLVSKNRNELGSKQNKSEELQIPGQTLNSWEYFSTNKNIFKEISEKMKEKDGEHIISPILVSENSLDANKSKNISNVPVSIPNAENVESGQQVVVEGKYEKSVSVVESLTVQTMEFSIQNDDEFHRASDARNDVRCLNGNDSSSSEHMNINKITEGKECTALSTSQASPEKENVLLSEQTGKLKVSESRSKRKPQKKRSIADIIASNSSCPEGLNKETEESESVHGIEKNVCITENSEKSPRRKRDYIKVTIDAVKKSSELTIDTNGISEVNMDAEMNNVIIEKRHPEKLKVKKKRPGIEIESLYACSTFVAKNSSPSSLSEAVTDGLQMPQGTSLFSSASKDKAPHHNFLHPEYGQSGKNFSEMEDEIPMDIVELMAKNQHERGLLNLKRVHEGDNLQNGRKRLKTKETDLSHIKVTSIEGGIGLRQNTTTPKSKAQPKRTGKANLQASLRNHCQSDLLEDYFQGVSDNSFISGKEDITSGSWKGDLARLQSTQWFNPWEKYSRDFVAPVLDETISACNPPFPIDGSKSHVAITHCDQYKAFSTNNMVVDSMQLQGVSTYCGHMQMQNLCREGTPAISGFTGSVLPTFQRRFESSLNHNGHSHQNLTNSIDSMQNMANVSSDLRNSGKIFDIRAESHKGNGIPNLSVKADGRSVPLYFNGQSNSALLQQVNAQARQPFGKKYCFPSTPVLRLLGQSVSVPAKNGNEEIMATENKDNINFSSLSHASSQKHVSWFQSSGLTARDQRETFSGMERVFTGSQSIQDSMRMNEQNTSSIKAKPPVPKFRPSGHYASNGLPGSSTPSSAAHGNTSVALESSNLRTKSPVRGTQLSGKNWKKELPCTNGYNDGNLQIFSTAPPVCQSTKFVRGSSFTKGLRSYRPTPMTMHLNGKRRSVLDNFLENRHHGFQSSWILGSNPQQNLGKEADKAKALNLNKENGESAFSGRKACNVEICTLNQNPAEVNIYGEEDEYSFGYEHFTLSHRYHGHSERKRDMAIPQGLKRRRTLKKKHMREFLSQMDGYVRDPAKENVDNLHSLGQELTSVKELVGNIN